MSTTQKQLEEIISKTGAEIFNKIRLDAQSLIDLSEAQIRRSFALLLNQIFKLYFEDKPDEEKGLG